MVNPGHVAQPGIAVRKDLPLAGDPASPWTWVRIQEWLSHCDWYEGPEWQMTVHLLGLDQYGVHSIQLPTGYLSGPNPWYITLKCKTFKGRTVLPGTASSTKVKELSRFITGMSKRPAQGLNLSSVYRAGIRHACSIPTLYV